MRDWTQVSGGTFSVNPYPSSTGLSGSSTWNSSNGIGLIYSSSTDSTLRGFNRSGAYDANTTAGVFTLYLSFAPTYGFTNLGFRATK